MFLLILVQIYKKIGENRMLNVIFIKKNVYYKVEIDFGMKKKISCR